MKRLLLLVLVVILGSSFVSCSEDKTTIDTKTTSGEVTERPIGPDGPTDGDGKGTNTDWKGTDTGDELTYFENHYITGHRSIGDIISQGIINNFVGILLKGENLQRSGSAFIIAIAKDRSHMLIATAYHCITSGFSFQIPSKMLYQYKNVDGDFKTLDVDGIVSYSPSFDVVILRVNGVFSDAEPLALSQSNEILQGDSIRIIGTPGEDKFNSLMSSTVQLVDDTRFYYGVDSTWYGMSGGAIVSESSNSVIGIPIRMEVSSDYNRSIATQVKYLLDCLNNPIYEDYSFIKFEDIKKDILYITVDDPDDPIYDNRTTLYSRSGAELDFSNSHSRLSFDSLVSVTSDNWARYVGLELENSAVCFFQESDDSVLFSYNVLHDMIFMDSIQYLGEDEYFEFNFPNSYRNYHRLVYNPASGLSGFPVRIETYFNVGYKCFFLTDKETSYLVVAYASVGWDDIRPLNSRYFYFTLDDNKCLIIGNGIDSVWETTYDRRISMDRIPSFDNWTKVENLSRYRLNFERNSTDSATVLNFRGYQLIFYDDGMSELIYTGNLDTYFSISMDNVLENNGIDEYFSDIILYRKSNKELTSRIFNDYVDFRSGVSWEFDEFLAYMWFSSRNLCLKSTRNDYTVTALSSNSDFISMNLELSADYSYDINFESDFSSSTIFGSYKEGLWHGKEKFLVLGDSFSISRLKYEISSHKSGQFLNKDSLLKHVSPYTSLFPNKSYFSSSSELLNFYKDKSIIPKN